jgi:hypothetical protein
VKVIPRRYPFDKGDVQAQVLLPRRQPGVRLPVVLVFGQGGPELFLRRRAGAIADLVRQGQAVVLLDLGWASPQPPGARRGRTSASTSLASSLLMLGRPTVGLYLRQLRHALRCLLEDRELNFDPKRISLWGDSFAPANGPGTPLEVPLELPQPPQAEPMGAILALLCGLFEDNIASIRASGGLAGYRSLLHSPFCHVPYDIVVPGALTADLDDLAAALAPVPLRLERLVDGLNRPVVGAQRERFLRRVRAAYREAKAEGKLSIHD